MTTDPITGSVVAVHTLHDAAVPRVEIVAAPSLGVPRRFSTRTSSAGPPTLTASRFLVVPSIRSVMSAM